MAQATPAQINQNFLANALRRNWSMPTISINQGAAANGQVLDIELDSVPGWASHIDVMVNLDLAITLAADTGVAPTLSPFAPFNFFQSVEISLGGGPFQRVNPYFYFLRELAMHRGWAGGSVLTPAYASGSVQDIPAVTATAGTTKNNVWKFPIRIPLQVAPGTMMGHLPMGTSAVKAKLRLTVASAMHGTDQYSSPLYGGTDVTSVVVGSSVASWVQPNITFLTTPALKADLGQPVIQYLLNVQERSTPFTAAGSLTPIHFPDPFKYMRLWHIVIDGTGAPNSAGVTNFELDLTPGYPQYNYAGTGPMMDYFNKVRRQYQTDLPVGVFVHDLFAGSDNANPNDTQIIDGTVYQTMQTQVAVGAAVGVGSPARIITYAEALNPVGF
jgi:hypothetical protein